MPQEDVFKFLSRYGMSEKTLALRREFIHLDERDRQTLMEHLPWMRGAAEAIAHDFYDRLFSFTRTYAYFQGFAAARGVTLTSLRTRLEGTQTSYLRSVFEGAQDGWDAHFFEHRFHIGWLHDQIDLPFKWYIGAYALYDQLIPQHLERAGMDDGTIRQIMMAVRRVFNLDMQAIGDSFLLSTLESMGLSVETVHTAHDADRTEHLDQIKTQVDTLKRQAAAIAARRLSDPVLEEAVEGPIGEAFRAIVVQFREFVTSTSEAAKALNAAVATLTATSATIMANARDTTKQADQLVASAQQVSANMDSIAINAQAFEGSIQEIATSANDTDRVARNTSSLARAANDTVGGLESSSRDIGDFIRVIAAIANQSKMLALNATIEAARAGDVGRGFAVVAGEVKELAMETNVAVQDIERKVGAMQNDSRAAAEAIESINEAIRGLDDLAGVVAAAVEEQTAATAEMRHNIDEAARAGSTIAQNMARVAEVARLTSAGTDSILDAANNLSELAQRLDELIARYE